MPQSDGALDQPATRARVFVVIPALDEEASVGLVLEALPWARLDRVIVADNGSQDGTAAVARAGGATVVDAPRRGYGSACLAGLAELGTLEPDDVVVFLDADFSDHPDELPELLAPLFDGRAELVIGSRALGRREPGALLPQQRFGNWLATALFSVPLHGRVSGEDGARARRRLVATNWARTAMWSVRGVLVLGWLPAHG